MRTQYKGNEFYGSCLVNPVKTEQIGCSEMIALSRRVLINQSWLAVQQSEQPATVALLSIGVVVQRKFIPSESTSVNQLLVEADDIRTI